MKSVMPDFQKNAISLEDKKISAFRTKLLLGSMGVGGAAVIGIGSEAEAQTTSIDVTTVSAQTAAATTAITTVGVTLLAMAFGLLVFSVATNVIRRVMGG